MNEEYWRLIQLKKSLEILKEQENGTITRTEIDDMNRNIQITKLCYNDGYNEGFQKGKLEERERIIKILKRDKGFCNEYEYIVDDMIKEIIKEKERR